MARRSRSRMRMMRSLRRRRRRTRKTKFLGMSPMSWVLLLLAGAGTAIMLKPEWKEKFMGLFKKK